MNKKEFKDVINKINKEKDIYKLVDNYEDFCLNFTCRPNRNEYPYPKKDAVIDENKSVKWNREEVERQRINYEQRVKELNTWKNIIADKYVKTLAMLLAEENNISFEESLKIFDYSYNQGKDYGLKIVVNIYDDLINLYEDLLKVRKNNKKVRN